MGETSFYSFPSSSLYAKILWENITIKYGGAAMGENNLSISFAKDIALLKQVGINPVVVHGGGPRIKIMLDRLKVKKALL